MDLKKFLFMGGGGNKNQNYVKDIKMSFHRALKQANCFYYRPLLLP